jgi:hypothetical protein
LVETELHRCEDNVDSNSVRKMKKELTNNDATKRTRRILLTSALTYASPSCLISCGR